VLVCMPMLVHASLSMVASAHVCLCAGIRPKRPRRSWCTCWQARWSVPSHIGPPPSRPYSSLARVSPHLRVRISLSLSVEDIGGDGISRPSGAHRGARLACGALGSRPWPHYGAGRIPVPQPLHRHAGAWPSPSLGTVCNRCGYWADESARLFVCACVCLCLCVYENVWVCRCAARP
jgi:hypothetical protein